jgi:hypothetical protein
MKKVNGRAYSPEEKRVIMERILTVWIASGDMRLGQLIENSLPLALANDPYYVEDEVLAEYIESFHKKVIATK